MGEKTPDRRTSGFTKVEISDGNGGVVTKRYSWNVTRAKAWIGAITGGITLASVILGGVWAIVSYGIKQEAHKEIVREVAPGGVIDDCVQKATRQAAIMITEELQSNLGEYDERLQTIERLGEELVEGQQDAVAKAESQAISIQRNQEELKILLHRAINGS